MTNKLLLTALVSGLMTTQGSATTKILELTPNAANSKTYGSVHVCMPAKFVADKQKEADNKEEFIFTVEENNIKDVWKVTGAVKPAKTLDRGDVVWGDNGGIKIQCSYNDGLTATLIKNKCENGVQ